MATRILQPDSPTRKTTPAELQRESQDTPTKPLELCHKCGLRPVAPARAKVRHYICSECFEQLPSNSRYRLSSKWRDVRRQYERTEGGKGVRQRYAATDKGKATQHRYNESTRGKLRTKRDTVTALVARPQSDLVESHQERNLALATSFEQFLLARTCSEHTKRAYGRVVQDFLAFVHNGNLDELSHLAIREYLHWLQSRGLSPQSIARETFALKAFFAFLERLGIVEFSPAKRIRNRQLPQRLPRWLTEKEMERFLAAADNPRDKAAVELAYATGCRISELLGIRLENINFDQRTILVLGKGKKERMVLFGRPAARALKRHLNGQKRGFLFHGRKGQSQPMETRNMRNIIYQVGKRAGLGRVNPHAIRHSFATHLLNGGAGLLYVKELLGHASVNTTAIYLHTSTASLADVMRRCHPRWKKGKHGK